MARSTLPARPAKRLSVRPPSGRPAASSVRPSPESATRHKTIDPRRSQPAPARQTAPTHYVGIEWGSDRMTAVAVDAQGRTIGELVFSDTATGVRELHVWLTDLLPDVSTCRVAVETSRGTAVTGLLSRGVRTFTSDPVHVDRVRHGLRAAGASDDRRALAIALALRRYAHLFRELTRGRPQ